MRFSGWLFCYLELIIPNSDLSFNSSLILFETNRISNINSIYFFDSLDKANVGWTSEFQTFRFISFHLNFVDLIIANS